MKLWINRARGGHCGGLAIVAANTQEEAHGTLLKDEYIAFSDYYSFDNWECIENATIDATEPYIIAEDSHEG